MESSRMTDAAHTAGVREGAARTLAQATCLIGGLALIAAGVLGFFFGGSDFDTGGTVNGEDFIVFEVNGWHNVVHIATGAFLLLMSPKAKSAVIGLVVFGLLYVAVTIWGFIAGDDLAEIVAIDSADNVLHAVLAGGALLVAILSGGLAAAGRKARPDIR